MGKSLRISSVVRRSAPPLRLSVIVILSLISNWAEVDGRGTDHVRACSTPFHGRACSTPFHRAPTIVFLGLTDLPRYESHRRGAVERSGTSPSVRPRPSAYAPVRHPLISFFLDPQTGRERTISILRQLDLFVGIGRIAIKMDRTFVNAFDLPALLRIDPGVGLSLVLAA